MAASSPILRSPLLQWLLAHLFPRLREWSVGQWPSLLDKARQVEFDSFERLITMACVILVALLLRPLGSLEESALLAYLAQFIYLLPLLLIAMAPFFVRRIRRGLEAAYEERKTGASRSEPNAG